MSRPSKYTQEVVDVLLDSFRRGSSVRGACGSADISTATYAQWKMQYPVFREKVEIAQNKSIAIAETHLEKAIRSNNFVAIKYFLDRRLGDNQHKRNLEDMVVDRFGYSKIISGHTGTFLMLNSALNFVSPEYRDEFKKMIRECKEKGKVRREDLIVLEGKVPLEQAVIFSLAFRISEAYNKALGIADDDPVI